MGGSAFISSSCGGIVASQLTHHDDVHVAINLIPVTQLFNAPYFVPLPWQQGRNVVSEICQIAGSSAFNGYPIASTDQPFTLQLPFYLTKIPTWLTTRNLKIIWFNPTKKRWQILKTPMIINEIQQTISTTTQNFGFFAVGY